MDKILTNKVAVLKKSLEAAGIPCVKEKKINYGYQIVCGNELPVTVNIYYGKKGLSIVVQGKETPLKKKVLELANGGNHLSIKPSVSKRTKQETRGTVGSILRSTDESIHPEGVSAWMGCDESGKGDVFGPLTAAACIITDDEEKRLRAMGVCDSKMLDDTRIAGLAKQIKGLLGDRCTVKLLMPCEYNQLYDTMKMNHKNLNNLLGSVHAENIRILLSKNECPCIIVDKFGKDEYVLSGLTEFIPTHQIIQVPRGERDIAVAAASILARQAFVEAMAELSRTYDMAFPKGAWMGIKEAIHTFCCRYGEEKLKYVGKLNFRNFDFLRG